MDYIKAVLLEGNLHSLFSTDTLFALVPPFIPSYGQKLPPNRALLTVISYKQLVMGFIIMGFAFVSNILVFGLAMMGLGFLSIFWG